jgi:hypothetical protein
VQHQQPDHYLDRREESDPPLSLFRAAESFAPCQGGLRRGLSVRDLGDSASIPAVGPRYQVVELEKEEGEV